MYKQSVLVIISLLLFGCSFKKPQAPSWHTTLNVPLLDRVYTVTEMVKDVDKVSIDETGRLGFHLEENIDTIKVDDHFKLDSFTQSFQVKLTDLETPAFNINYERFSFAQLCPAISGSMGATVTAPATTFSKVAGDKHADDNFRSALVATGMGFIRLYNRLPVSLENVVLQLQDQNTGEITITSPVIPRISKADSATANLVLDGKRIPEKSQWLISGTNLGSANIPIPIRSDQVLDLVARMDKVRVSRIEAKIPAIPITVSKTITMMPDMSITVSELAFRQGLVSLTLDNRTPFGVATVALQLDQIKNGKTGAPMSFSMSIEPFKKSVMQLNLEQFVARLDPPVNGGKQSLTIQLSGLTKDLSDHFEVLDESTAISAALQFSNIVIDRLAGKLAQRQVALDTVRENFRLPDQLDDFDNVHFNDARMTVYLYHTLQMPLRFEGKITASNSKGERAQFLINEQIKPSTGPEVILPLRPFTSSNSEIVRLIDIRANKIEAGGQAWVGDGVTYGQVKASDYFRGKIVVDVPATVTWTAQEVHLDTTQLEVRPESLKGEPYQNGEIKQISGELTGRLASARITAKIENHLPVGGILQFRLAEALAKLYDASASVIGPVTLPAATTDAAGKVLQARNIEVTIDIDELDLAMLKNSGSEIKPIFIATDLKMDGTNGQAKQIFGNDYIKIQALMALTVLVKTD